MEKAIVIATNLTIIQKINPKICPNLYPRSRDIKDAYDYLTSSVLLRKTQIVKLEIAVELITAYFSIRNEGFQW